MYINFVYTFLLCVRRTRVMALAVNVSSINILSANSVIISRASVIQFATFMLLHRRFFSINL